VSGLSCVFESGTGCRHVERLRFGGNCGGGGGGGLHDKVGMQLETEIYGVKM
jgi:hypothetical protein